jgi:hypothetical protein
MRATRSATLIPESPAAIMRLESIVTAQVSSIRSVIVSNSDRVERHRTEFETITEQMEET